MSRSRHDAPGDEGAANALRTLAAALSEDAAAIRPLGRTEFDTAPVDAAGQEDPAHHLALIPAMSRAREALAAAYADSARRVAALAVENPSHPHPRRGPRA